MYFGGSAKFSKFFDKISIRILLIVPPGISPRRQNSEEALFSSSRI